MIVTPKTVGLSKLGHKVDSPLARVEDWVRGLEPEIQTFAKDNADGGTSPFRCDSPPPRCENATSAPFISIV